MTKRFFVFCLLSVFALGLFSCATAGKAGDVSFTEQPVAIPSARGTQIPGTLTIPKGSAGEKFPVIIFAHGHGGNKDESGGFALLAQALAKNGLASLRIDFPGCGDSKENFVAENNLHNMLDDVRSSKTYLTTVAAVDLSRLGLLGYSMGGRIAAIIAAEDPAYVSVAFWSPAVSSGGVDMYNFMKDGGDANFNALYAEAKEKGQATYTAVYGFEQTLGLSWFNDMTQIEPLANFSAYKGNVLLVTGASDEIISTDVAKAVTRAATGAKSIKEFEVPEADHGYGIYAERPDITQKAVNESVSFFKATL
jgi:dienelactone hydrolase